MERLVRIVFGGIGQHKPDQECRSRPIKAAHQYAKEPDGKQGHKVHQVLARLERRKAYDHKQKRGKQNEPDRRQLGNATRCGNANDRTNNVCQGQKPDNRIRNIEVVLQHSWADLDLAGAQQRNCADKDRHRA